MKKVRFTFRSEVVIEAETLNDANDLFESIDLFSKEAKKKYGADFIELVSVEDAETHKDLMDKLDVCIEDNTESHGYVILVWPDSQNIMGIRGMRENTALINDDKGLEEFGSSAYVVSKEWYENNPKEEMSEEELDGLASCEMKTAQRLIDSDGNEYYTI